MKLFIRSGDEFKAEVRETKKLAKRSMKKMKAVEKSAQKPGLKERKWAEMLELLLPEELLEFTGDSRSEVTDSLLPYGEELQ